MTDKKEGRAWSGPTLLSLKIGYSPPGLAPGQGGKMGIGGVLYPARFFKGELIPAAMETEWPLPSGDDLEAKAEATLQLFYREGMKPGSDKVSLKKFSLVTFGGSRAAREGMTWDQHNRLVDITAARLRAAGIEVDVILSEVEE